MSGASTNGVAIGVTRHFDTGLPDTGFGTAGKVVVPNYRNYKDTLATGVLQADGKLVLGGSRTNKFGSIGSEYWLVVRLNSNGSLDKTFNKTGYAMTAVYNASKVTTQSVQGLRVQPDGKILAVGTLRSRFGRVAGGALRVTTPPVRWMPRLDPPES